MTQKAPNVVLRGHVDCVRRTDGNYFAVDLTCHLKPGGLSEDTKLPVSLSLTNIPPEIAKRFGALIGDDDSFDGVHITVEFD
jgi:hypothetical protein